MALDKLVDSTRLDSALTATANAILSKTGGSSAITWDMDEGFADAIEDIETGGVIISDTTDSHGGTIKTITTKSTPVVLQAKTGINPTSSSQTITHDNGYDGLSSVQINGDANLVAGNIKNGTTIFGVTGTYSGGGGGGAYNKYSYTFTPDTQEIIVPHELVNKLFEALSANELAVYGYAEIYGETLDINGGRHGGYLVGSNQIIGAYLPLDYQIYVDFNTNEIVLAYPPITSEGDLDDFSMVVDVYVLAS